MCERSWIIERKLLHQQSHPKLNNKLPWKKRRRQNYETIVQLTLLTLSDALEMKEREWAQHTKKEKKRKKKTRAHSLTDFMNEKSADLDTEAGGQCVSLRASRVSLFGTQRGHDLLSLWLLSKCYSPEKMEGEKKAAQSVVGGFWLQIPDPDASLV